MNRTWVEWLLGGALAASLAWNARQLGSDGAAPEGCTACSTSSCRQALERAGVTIAEEAKRRRVEELLGGCEARSVAEDGEAKALSDQLFGGLRHGGATFDVDGVRAAARRLGEVRAAAVARTVETLLELRELLGPADFARMMAVCCGGAVGCECCGAE